MQSVIEKIDQKYKKRQVVDVMPGDKVKVHQKIREGAKERVQIFEGIVLRVTRKNSPTSRITVRRIASGIGVEKSFIMHSPLVLKVEVTKRSKTRRNYLTYMRTLTGKSARMTGVEFDKEAVNTVVDEQAEEEEEEEAKLKEEKEKEHEAPADDKDLQPTDKATTQQPAADKPENLSKE